MADQDDGDAVPSLPASVAGNRADRIGASAADSLQLMRAGGVEVVNQAACASVSVLLGRQQAIDIRYPPLDVHRLQCCLSGRSSGTQTTPNLATPVAFRALAGVLNFVPAGQTAHLKEQGEASCLHLLIGREVMHDVATLLRSEKPDSESTLVAFNGQLDASIHECLVPVQRALRESQRSIGTLLECLVRAICVRLLDRCTQFVSAPSVTFERLSPVRLALALDALEREIDHPAGLEAVARAVGLSPHHFSRAFRNTTGLAPWRHVAQRRVERAQAMLESGIDSLAAVALACGYSSQAHMTSAFRRLVGTTPGRFRDECRFGPP